MEERWILGNRIAVTSLPATATDPVERDRQQQIDGLIGDEQSTQHRSGHRADDIGPDALTIASRSRPITRTPTSEFTPLASMSMSTRFWMGRVPRRSISGGFRPGQSA